MATRRLYRPPKPTRQRDLAYLGTGAASSAPPALPSDTFNRANAASLGTSSSGHAWDELGTAWSIASNQARPPTTADYRFATLDAGLADVTISATFDPKGAGGDMGLCARVVDANNLIFFDVTFDVGLNHWLCRVFQRVAGSFTALTSLVDPVAGLGNDKTTPFPVTLTVSGTGGEAFIGIVSMGTWSSVNASLVTPTKHGLAGNGADACAYDNLTIVAP